MDRSSRAARIQAGVFGPALENQLRPHGLTLRHFPQSFEFSTLGGWIATRSGGHFATLYTHIDDFVESLRVATPAGTLESRRLPGSGAGPSPDRMFIGSEGILGVITEAWVRLQDRPRFRAGGAMRFKDFFIAARALRVLSQAGLQLPDPGFPGGVQHRRRRWLGCHDDARSLLRGVYSTEVDIVPDPQIKTLIRLHPLANRSSDNAVRHLGAELNATETLFPGTDLRLIYELVSSQSQ